MNVGIVLLNFPLTYKMFSKSLSKCENKGEIKNKTFARFRTVPPEVYLHDCKCSEHKSIFKMLPQSIHRKHPLCQHLSAFLRDQGGQWF